MLGFYEYAQKLMEANNKVVQDADLADKNAREATPPAPHGMESSAKVIAEFSNKDKILSAEEIIEHRKHCRAKPGNCPFEKARDEADDISPKDIKVSKGVVFTRFAALLTQMFNMAKNLAKPAIVEPKAVEEKGDKSDIADKNRAPAQDEAPAITEEVQDDAGLIAEIIESGINRMVEMAKSKGCRVEMDEKKSKYIVAPPQKSPEKE